jgi:hypothetical protein
MMMMAGVDDAGSADAMSRPDQHTTLNHWPRKWAKTFTLCSLFEASEVSRVARRGRSAGKGPSWFLVPKGPSKGTGGHDMSLVD